MSFLRASMKAIDFYYQIKPAIPRSLQISLRRLIAARKRKRSAGVWPINPTAARPPLDWSGWPEKKKFALVLQHDVDTFKGLGRCLKLMELEKKLGFRSSFNFVPEDYPTPSSLIQNLVEAGFEIGVHGLKHDGKLFRHPAEFCLKVPRINYYLKKWGAVGFTSPSMLRNLEWIAELDIEHSCSTFDTDPFEPQSEGINTIFPFLASNESKSRTYVELPYTLPQDHGLFVILGEKDNRIWKDKIDWLAERGGMAELNTHPDYMVFDGAEAGKEEYPVDHYLDFLDYIQGKYSGQYWQALPQQIARFWRETAAAKRQEIPRTKGARPLPQDGLFRRNQKPLTPQVKVWIDLDNTPHVPFFIPVIRELERRGHEVVITARDAFQVCELADEKGLRYVKIGHHYGKNRFMKVAGLVCRSVQLLPFLLKQRPGISVSHGARSQYFISNVLGTPTIVIADYEHARVIPFSRPQWMIVPEVISPEGLPSKVSHVRCYRGIKEDVYAPELRARPSLMDDLGLRPDEIIVTVRPPADEAHYYRPESGVLFHELMARVRQSPGVRAVLLPRNSQQAQTFRSNFPEWFEGAKTLIPKSAVDGLDLLWISDLVVSGGGTMNREAAALGVPVYSIFRGKTGAVDMMLEAQGRLTMIKDKEEIWSKIALVGRNKSRPPDNAPRATLEDIVDQIESIIRIERVRPRCKNGLRRA